MTLILFYIDNKRNNTVYKKLQDKDALEQTTFLLNLGNFSKYRCISRNRNIQLLHQKSSIPQ